MGESGIWAQTGALSDSRRARRRVILRIRILSRFGLAQKDAHGGRNVGGICGAPGDDLLQFCRVIGCGANDDQLFFDLLRVSHLDSAWHRFCRAFSEWGGRRIRVRHHPNDRGHGSYAGLYSGVWMHLSCSPAFRGRIAISRPSRSKRGSLTNRAMKIQGIAVRSGPFSNTLHLTGFAMNRAGAGEWCRWLTADRCTLASTAVP